MRRTVAGQHHTTAGFRDIARARRGHVARWRGAAVAVASFGLAVALFPARIEAQQFLTQTQSLPDGRQMHGTAALADYLYVFSGFSEKGTSTGSVIKAPIAPDGTLGAWEETTPLPAPRLYIGNSTLVLNDTVYIAGGSADPLTSVAAKTVAYARPGAGGSLLPWQESPPLPVESGLIATAAVSTPGHIHVIGGLRKSNSVADVWSIRVNADGTLQSWEQGPALPQPLWYLQAATVGGRVFAWGGIPGDSKPKPPSAAVYSAPILGSGQLGVWAVEPASLPVPFYSASVAVAGPYIINFSPRLTGAAMTNDIWWTLVLPTGIQGWQKLASDCPSRIYHAAATDYRRGNVYLNGGRPQKTPMVPGTFSYCFRLSPEAREAAMAAWRGALPGAAGEAATSGAGSTEDSFAHPSATYTGFSYQTAENLPADAIPGFRTIAQARSHVQSGQAPSMIVYFTSRDAPICKRQNELLRAPTFAARLSTGNFAWVDVRDNPQEAYALGVWRVPTWIVYDAAGTEIGRRPGVMTPEQFQ